MYCYIETPRLILRDLLLTDIDGLYALESDTDVLRHFGKQPVQSTEECRQAILAMRTHYATNGIGRLAVIDKSSNSFIGLCGLKLMTTAINGRSDYYDLGYRLIKREWGKGYATEAALAMVQYARDKQFSKDICAFAAAENLASQKVLDKLGMHRTDTFFYEDRQQYWYEFA